jgi:hypothetical protein
MVDDVYVNLNPHSVTTVTPDKCLFHYYSDYGLYIKSKPFRTHCKKCEFNVSERSCAYRVCVVEGATGNYDGSDEELHYIQWCCVECGELIKLQDSISYIYHDLTQHSHTCAHCKTVHKCLKYDDDTFTFAVPIKVTVSKGRMDDWSEGDRCR